MPVVINEFEVVPAHTTTRLDSSSNPSVFRQTVTFIATVDAPSGAGTPIGTVTFQIDGTPQAPVTLSGGRATLTPTHLSVGIHPITATYNGDPSFIGSQSFLAPAQTVKEAEKQLIIRALKETKGNRTLAARKIGMSRRSLHRKLHNYGLEGF